MHGLSRWGVVLTACLGAALTTSGGDKFVLVREGTDQAPIIVAQDATPFTRIAAGELAGFIEKISGARPMILEEMPDPLPERAIWIGLQPFFRKIFPDTDFELRHAEEILIVADGRNLVIAGRDIWDPQNHVRQLSRGRTVENVQREYGTVNAIYTFVQDFLDVRWLWPGSLGEDIPQRATIEFAPFEYRYHPQFRGRIGLFSRCSLAKEGFRTASADQNWARYQRLLFDSLDIPGGHAYGDWWERFHETHPEYLALQPDG
ncbi:MAG: hypothetical protein LC725_10330, partial [Lentisphaerae bacterium]|nr:hypothetical protein [Lentisphaerota bacterium]